MAQDDVTAVVGERRAVVDVGDDTVGRGQNWIGRFTAGVALEAFDVETLMNLPAVGANAAEGAGDPGLTGSGDEIPFLATRLKNGVIGGGQFKGLRAGRECKGEHQARKENRPSERWGHAVDWAGGDDDGANTYPAFCSQR